MPMADPGFVATDASTLAVRLLCAGTLLYAILTLQVSARAFRSRLEDRWSSFAAGLVLAALAALLWTDGARVLPDPFGPALAWISLGAIVVTLTWTVGRYEAKIRAFRDRFGARLNELLFRLVPEDRHAEFVRLREEARLGPEARRKTPHLMMGVFLAVQLGVGAYLLRGAYAVGDLSWRAGTGFSVEDAGARLGSVAAANLYRAAYGDVLSGSHILALWGLLGLLFLLAPTELLRLRYPELSYPFKATILSRLRKRETGLFGAHYYIAAALPLAALWMTRDPSAWDRTVPGVVAILGITVFADAASALVGIRWGRTKWFHNPGKSYIGTVGGTAVAFAVALPLVGPVGAIAGAAAFALVDIVAPVPFPVSDNILNPVVLAATFSALEGQLHPSIPWL
jgi:dolichol kinase